MKTCKKCKIEKPEAEFNKRPKMRDGLSGQCKACVRSYNAGYRAVNPERGRAANAKWYAANHERLKAKSSAWITANQDKVKSRVTANKDKIKALVAAYQKAHPEVRRIHRQNRRASETGGKLSKGIAEKLFKLQRGKCVCCKQPLGSKYHLDHIMPLSRGGTNTDGNMQLLRSTCNLNKHAKHPVDFMRQRGYLL